MGTNYYVVEDVCKHCGRGDDEIHIGKSSAGWCFSLHVTPEDDINSLDDWKKFWAGKEIRDEYGDKITEDRMLDVITNRGSKDNGRDWDELPWGYDSWEKFHLDNHSRQGPRGLLRHLIGDHCVGNGEGTWDLIPGEFS